MIRQIKFGIIALLSILYLVLLPALAIPQLGVSWDEPYQRHYGEIMCDYIIKGSPTLLTDNERHYGPLVPALLYVPEFLGIVNTPLEIYELRHWFNWGLFLFGLPFIYLMSRRSGLPHSIAFINSVVVATTPVIATHGLFNSKDIPLMSACIALCWLISWYTDHPNRNRALVLGIGIGLALLTRINAINVIIILIAAAVLIYPHIRKNIIHLIITVIASMSMLYLGWPTLWSDPFGAFTEAYSKMSNYPWLGYVLFNGKIISAQALPWYYIPTWMGLTLSPFLLIGITASTVYGAVTLKNWIKQFNPTLILLGTISIVPLLAAMIVRPTLYDSWRHLFFIYPGIIILTSYGLFQIAKHKMGKSFVIGIMLLFAINTTVSWINYFPFAHCYLNRFAGTRESMMYRWEIDYWGLSYRALYQKLPSGTVYAEDYPAIHGYAMLSEFHKLHLKQLNDPQNAQYYVTNHRLNPRRLPLPIEAEVVRDGIVFTRAYRLR